MFHEKRAKLGRFPRQASYEISQKAAVNSLIWPASFVAFETLELSQSVTRSRAANRHICLMYDLQQKFDLNGFRPRYYLSRYLRE
jgi:hypothetical protein